MVQKLGTFIPTMIWHWQIMHVKAKTRRWLFVEKTIFFNMICLNMAYKVHKNHIIKPLKKLMFSLVRQHFKNIMQQKGMHLFFHCYLKKEKNKSILFCLKIELFPLFKMANKMINVINRQNVVVYNWQTFKKWGFIFPFFSKAFIYSSYIWMSILIFKRKSLHNFTWVLYVCQSDTQHTLSYTHLFLNHASTDTAKSCNLKFTRSH